MDRNDLEALLASTVRSSASTLHLVAGRAPCMRVQGTLVQSEGEAIRAQALEDLTKDILFADHRTALLRGQEVEILYCARSGIRFRTSIQQQSQGLSLVFRRVPREVPTLEDLGLPELVSSFVGFQSGLVVLTGFVGSGKSTTLAALVEHLNREVPLHLMSIESPIEFVFQQGAAVVHQREVGHHVSSFAEGIREARLHSADVVVVGELQDVEALDAALDAAESGMLVLTTLHASSVGAALAQAIGMVAPEERLRLQARLAGCLRVVMAQTLLQRSHQKGRVPLLEILVTNQSAAKAIRSGALEDLPDIMQKGRGVGMQTVDQGLRALLNRNLITLDEALYHAADRNWICSGQRAAKIG